VSAAPTPTTAYDTAWSAAMRPWWHVVARSGDLPPGGVLPVRLLGEDFVLWRDERGAAHLNGDTCPHRGVRLSLGAVEHGCIRCPYHGWAFDGSGTCRSIPQLGHGRTLPGARLASARVHDDGFFVWACLADEADERGGVPRFEVLTTGTHWFWMGEPHDWDAQNLRQIENFCDVAHFSVLHLDTFGHESGQVCEPSRMTVEGRTIEFEFEVPVGNPNVPPGPDRDFGPGRFDYRVTLPCTVHLGGASGPGSVMFVHSTPIDVYRTRVYWGCAFPIGQYLDGESYAAVEAAIWAPDRTMVASQRPRGLPLQPTAELHLPHDRFALAFRRALGELGVPSSIPDPEETFRA